MKANNNWYRLNHIPFLIHSASGFVFKVSRNQTVLWSLLQCRTVSLNFLFSIVTVFEISLSVCFCVQPSECPKPVATPRPDRLVNRLKSITLDDASAPRLVIIRQPRGPDNSKVNSPFTYLGFISCLKTEYDPP